MAKRNNKICMCGCGNETINGNKFVKGHFKMTNEQKQKLKDSWQENKTKRIERIWTYERREVARKNFKEKNPMHNDKSKEKLINTCINKYGCKNGGGSNEAINKIKKTSIEKYGVDNYSKLDECTNKIKEIKKKKYDNENYNNVEKYKKTCLEKYGVDNVQKVKQIKEKSIDTYTKRLSNGEYQITNNWKTGYFYKNDGSKEWFDSSFEQKRMEYYENNNIKWTKKHKIRIPYINSKGLNTYYVPDFYILLNDNIIIEEIKGWIKGDDVLKCEAAKQYCKQNNIQYRFLLGENFILQEELSYVIN